MLAIVEDMVDVANTLIVFVNFSYPGTDVRVFQGPAEFEAAVRSGFVPQVIITDVELESPGDRGNALDVFRLRNEKLPCTPFVIMTAGIRDALLELELKQIVKNDTQCRFFDSKGSLKTILDTAMSLVEQQ